MTDKQSQPQGDVAVVIPAYNEAGAIGETVENIRAVFPRVIVVDDGSRDDTAAVASGAGASVVRHPINLGQGGALQTGISAALMIPQVQIILTYDADGQHRPEDALAMAQRLRRGDVDVVLGTRFSGETPVEASAAKKALLKAATAYSRWDTGLRLTDTHNGLRAMSRDFASGLQISESGMGHASEILEYIAQSKARYVEIPVHIRYTDYSRAKGQPMINSVNILFDRFLR